jgi:hypothetical protein
LSGPAGFLQDASPTPAAPIVAAVSNPANATGKILLFLPGCLFSCFILFFSFHLRLSQNFSFWENNPGFMGKNGL